MYPHDVFRRRFHSDVCTVKSRIHSAHTVESPGSRGLSHIPLNCPHGSRVQHTPFLVFREVQNDVATVKREICSLDAGVLFAQEACSWVYGVNDIAKRNPSNLRTSLTLHPAPCTLRPTP